MSLKDYPLIGDWVGFEGTALLVRTGKVDIGQRISTALAQIAHEELSIPHDRIRVVQVETQNAPDEGITSGSNSLEYSGYAIRAASATLRGLLLSRAADRWGGALSDWDLEDGLARRAGKNSSVLLQDLIEDSDFSVVADPSIPPIPRASVPMPAMRGLEEMVTGRFVYVHDLDVPGQWHARVVRPPHAQARLQEAPEAVRTNLEADGIAVMRDGSFVAVAGPDEWAVIQAAQKLANACRWDTGVGLPEGDPQTALTTSNAVRLPVVDGQPLEADLPPDLDAPHHLARYERPYTLHGALAPSAGFALWDKGIVSIKSHSQGIYPLRESIAESLGLGLEAVEITHVPGSGCYGHNGADDAAYEAALVAMAFPGRPILLKWTREDEHAWEPFGTPMAVELAARTDDAGRVSHYSADAISDTHRGRPRPGPGAAGPSKLLANRFRESACPVQRAAPNMNPHGGMHRNLGPIYDFPETRLVKNLVANIAHRTSALRCLGAAVNVFAIESFMDELADVTSMSPLAYRKAHLADRRGLAVLERLSEAMEQTPKPDGLGRGIAYAQYKNAMARVGVVVDLDVDDRAEVHLHRAHLVVDAGRVIDAGGLTAQIEGGFLQGASWALYEEVTWDRDGITSRDWDSYPVLRFGNVPEITVELIDRPDDPPSGAGEASPGPAIAAIANAIFDATGLRLRRLPFRPDAVRTAAAS